MYNAHIEIFQKHIAIKVAADPKRNSKTLCIKAIRREALLPA